MIYETKGLSLEQIDELYDEVKVAKNSVGWKPTTTFRGMMESAAAQGGQGPEEGEKSTVEEGQRGDEP